MTNDSLNKRLSRLSDAASPMASLADSLDMGAARQKAREDEWRAAGNTGRMPPEPLEPPPTKTARRYDRELWRKIAHGEARLLFPPDRTDELQAAYAMSDEDLWRTVSQRQMHDLARHHPPPDQLDSDHSVTDREAHPRRTAAGR